LSARPTIILASASPRRQELLRNAGIEFEVRAADIPEIPWLGEAPLAFAERMAREKARAVRALQPDRIILAADTVVTVSGDILGKPSDAADAVRMLRLLSNKTHQVITAACLAGDNFEEVRSETTEVHFSAIAENEVQQYVATGEPMDKAGAYAIQGGAGRWISKIEGDYTNVVGLPVDLVCRMLRERGIL
jgi:septum formation protein